MPVMLLKSYMDLLSRARRFDLFIILNYFQIEVRPLKDSEIKQSKEKDLDDSEVQGVSLNSLSRVELMAKLARGDELTTKGIPTPALGSIKDTVTVRESECIVLKNMFDSKE